MEIGRENRTRERESKMAEELIFEWEDERKKRGEERGKMVKEEEKRGRCTRSKQLLSAGM